MKDLFLKNNGILWILAIASLPVVFMMPNRYYQEIVVMTYLWAGLSSAWNLYSGYCGRLSIGHAAYMGIGAYTSSLLYMNYGVSPWIGMLAGGAIAAAAALMIGGTTLRLKGTFFVLSTIAFAEILKTVSVTAKEVTRGALGVQIPFAPGIENLMFSEKTQYGIVIWFYMMLVLALCVKMEKSKLGYGLIAVGENQQAAENLGVNATKTMLMAYVFSAVLTAFGGTLFAQYVRYIDPHTVMGLSSSILFILYAIAGGMGTAFGPMVGSFILVPLSLFLRGALPGINGLHNLILGSILILILLFRPDGILPSIRNAMHARKARAMKKEGGE